MISALITDIIARFGVRIAMGLGVVVAFLAWDSSRVNKGRQQERAVIERATNDVAEKAIKKQRAVPVDGAAQRLRREHCPDCR